MPLTPAEAASATLLAAPVEADASKATARSNSSTLRTSRTGPPSAAPQSANGSRITSSPASRVRPCACPGRSQQGAARTASSRAGTASRIWRRSAGFRSRCRRGTTGADALFTDLALLGWALGGYQFTRYAAAKRGPARLLVADAQQCERVLEEASAVALTRDLINTPAEDMLPSHLAAAAERLAEQCGAACEVTTGAALLERGLRTIHAVGRAASDAPRLIDLRWGQEDHPRVTLVGKGVCFDSGGLDIKPGSAMRTMKKDMGGAAQVLGLARLIMTRKLPIQLRVLVPAVENAIAGNAYRPGDVIETYQGTTVEIDNTDAEGRLVLCDALTLAREDDPELLIDYATLTGAARAAVGAEIAALFSSDPALAQEIYRAGVAQDDAVWPMPLHEDYAYLLESKVADTLNSAPSPFAGAITAALFLAKFTGTTPWVHFDLMAFNVRARPGRPEGGEAMGLRAVYAYLARRYGRADG